MPSGKEEGHRNEEEERVRTFIVYRRFGGFPVRLCFSGIFGYTGNSLVCPGSGIRAGERHYERRGRRQV